MNITIRAEVIGDEPAIEAVTITAFLNAAHTEHTEQFIVRALRAAGMLSISIVAEMQGEIVGHVAISPVSISDGTLDWYGLGPISVKPDYQGLGLGSALMAGGLARLVDMGAAGCVVLGEPAYYGRFGFKQDARLVLADVPAEYFQALLFGGDCPVGQVNYHDAFYVKS